MDKHLQILREFLIENSLPSHEDIIRQFGMYMEFLQNSPHNVTAIKTPFEIVVKHFIDSLFILKFYKNLNRKTKIIDIGTGAGFPGIPIKILFPEIELYLVESVKKKADFLKYLIDNLNISGIIILRERAETLGHEKNLREEFDLVVSRAVAPLPVLLELCAPFSKISGRFVAYKGEDVREELREAEKALELLNLIIEDIYFYQLPKIDHKRSLIFFKKTGKTPDKYPRRPGIPQKRPLK